MTTDKQYRLAEALLRLSHENSAEHEMKAAWDKFWNLCAEVPVTALSKKAQAAYQKGLSTWGIPAGKTHKKTPPQEPPKQPRWDFQEARNRASDWEYKQAYKSDPNPRGFTMRTDEQEHDRTYHTEYTHPQYGTRAERIMPDQHAHIWCHECGHEVDVTHYPGNTGKYCSPACKHRATNRQAAARMRAKRIRDKDAASN